MRLSQSLAIRISLPLAIAALAVPPSRAAQDRAFVITSNSIVSTLTVVDLGTRVVTRDVVSVGADAVPRFYDGLVYVVNRAGDNIQVVDPAQSYSTIRQFAVGNGTHPQDIAFVSPTKAYVSRDGSADLLIVNPSHPQGLPQTTLSLAALADSDGLPEMARMVLLPPYLFVACRRLTNSQPVNASVVAVLDVEADTLVDVDPFGEPGTQGIPLEVVNPVTTFAVHTDPSPGNQLLYIGAAGAYGVLDGGIQRIHPAGYHPVGVVLTDAQMGGDIAAVAWHSPTRAFAIAGTSDRQSLIGWNPANSTVTDTLLSANGGFSIPEMALNDRGELWVCRNPTPPAISKPPGLLVFGAAGGDPLSGLLETGLPPTGIAFGQVGPAPAAPGGVAIGVPRPNPAAGAAHVEFALVEAAPVRVTIFDLTGRSVRTLELGTRPAGAASFDWDLTGGDGRAVPAGLYVIRIEAAGRTGSRRIAVVR